MGGLFCVLTCFEKISRSMFLRFKFEYIICKYSGMFCLSWGLTVFVGQASPDCRTQVISCLGTLIAGTPGAQWPGSQTDILFNCKCPRDF